jgi:hypothetical protein
MTITTIMQLAGAAGLLLGLAAVLLGRRRCRACGHRRASAAHRRIHRRANNHPMWATFDRRHYDRAGTLRDRDEVRPRRRRRTCRRCGWWKGESICRQAHLTDPAARMWTRPEWEAYRATGALPAWDTSDGAAYRTVQASQAVQAAGRGRIRRPGGRPGRR